MVNRAIDAGYAVCMRCGAIWRRHPAKIGVAISSSGRWDIVGILHADQKQRALNATIAFNARIQLARVSARLVLVESKPVVKHALKLFPARVNENVRT